MTEDIATRRKRLSMRSWRRGMREMDMILGPFSDQRLGEMDSSELDEYESLLSDNDQEIFSWITQKTKAPDHRQTQIQKIVDFLSEGGGSVFN